MKIADESQNTSSHVSSVDSFEANSSAFVQSFQEMTECTKALLKNIYKSKFENLQEDLNCLAAATQGCVLDGIHFSSALTFSDDKKSIYTSMLSLLSASQELLGCLQNCKDVDKKDLKKVFSPHSKKVIGNVESLLNKIDSAKNSQLSYLKEQQIKEEEKEQKQLAALQEREQRLREGNDKITRVFQEFQEFKSVNPGVSEDHKILLSNVEGIIETAQEFVDAASVCQEKIDSQSEDNAKQRKKYFDNGTWSDGLVSAATHVANNAQEILLLAKDIILDDSKDNSKIDLFRVLASDINSSAIHVITASGVKNLDKSSQKMLQITGKALQNATEELTNTIKSSYNSMGQNNLDFASMTETQKNALEVEAHAKILKLERELEIAQQMHRIIREQKYRNSHDSSLPSP
ncbi:talin-1-like [Zophobas morio]|uniref:talin-1-like n=1 Tax=Zophobas morio TaxID=2755281 RepID=UPI003083EADE